MVVREAATDEAGERGRADQGDQLQPERIDAGGAGGVLVLANGLHAETQARSRERGHRRDRQHGQGQRQPVAIRQAIGGDRRLGQRRDLGERVPHGDPEDLAQRQRADGEVGAAQPEGRPADQQRERDGHEGAGDHPDHDGRARDPQHAGDQRAQPEEGRVTEVDLAGVTGDDVPGLRQRDRQEHEEEEVQDVLAAHHERNRGQGGDDDEARRRRGRAHHFAKSPCGRATSTTRKMTRPTTSR